MRSYPNHDLVWACISCGKKNIEPMHSDPQAHFVSMICVHCDHEEEDCACGRGVIVPSDGTVISVNFAAQQLGKKSAEKRFKGMSKSEKSEFGKELAKKRWKMERGT